VRQEVEKRPQGVGSRYETTLLGKDGRVIPVIVSARPLFKGGQFAGVLTAFTDITERRQEQEALRETRDRLQAIIRASPLAIFILDPDGNVKLWNPAAACIFGWSETEAVGRPLPVVPPEKQSEFRALLERVKGGESLTGVEVRRQKRDGTLIDVNIYAAPLYGVEGNIDSAMGVVADITEHKRAEEALRRRAEELAALYDTALDITMPHDLPDLLQAIVERAARLLNAPGGGLYLCDPARQEARCVVSYNTPRDFTGTVLKYGEGAAGIVAQTGKPLIIDDYRTWPDRAAVYDREQPFNAVLSAPMIWQDRVTGVIHVLHNVEARRFTEADLELLTMFARHAAIAVENAQLFEATRQRAAELEALAELSAALRTAQTADEMVRVCLKKSIEIGGMAVGVIYRVEPETGDLVVWGWHPPDLPLQTMRHRPGEGIAGHVAATGEIYSTPDIGRDPRAHILPEEAASISDIHAGISLPLRAGQGQIVGVMQLGRPAVHQFSEAEVRLLVAIAEMAGNALHRAQMMETLEERVAARTAELSHREAALQAANARLRDLERLKSQFLANASHELRTPLTNIIAYLDLLTRGKPEKRDHYMAILRREADLLHILVEGLLDVADLDFGKAQPALVPIDLNQLLETMLDTCKALVSDRNLQLQTHLAADLPWVLADAKMLKQVIVNLVSNAAEQTPSGGAITLYTRRQEDTGRAWNTLAVCAGGPGFRPEERARLLALIDRREAAHPSTTPGLGLRLAICQEIAQRHGGKITMESEASYGSAFTVWLPAVGDRVTG
jgi:PAS domain S-box-containing protein